MRDAQDPDVLTATTARSAVGPLRWSTSVALLVVAVDQLTKRWALEALEGGSCSRPGACIDLVWGLRFNLVFNTGAAFTRGEGYGPVLGILALVMAGFLLYLSTRRTDRAGVVLFGVIAGGAIGNLLDRIFRADDGPLSGAVVDFIDAQWWPVFNVADMAIVLGVIGVAILTFFERSDEPAAIDEGTAPASDADGGRDVGVTADVRPTATDRSE